MLRSYLKVALRGLRKNKLIAFINIFGLGLSMSVGMMIMIRLQDQLSYDNFHPYPERTFRITTDYYQKSGEHWKMASTPLPLNDKLRRDFSTIENSVNIYPAFGGKATYGGKELSINGVFTETSFFKVFGFTLAAGDPATALEKPNSMVITKEVAEKYFGGANPIGKVIRMESGDNFSITGVLNVPPSKSHIESEAFVSFASVAQLEKDKKLSEKANAWYALNAGYTYVVLKKGVAEKKFRGELNALTADLNKYTEQGALSFSTQPIGDITPGYENLQNSIGRGSSWTKVYFETGVALIILLAACFNYTNLTIARALTRAKEVGVRKVTGAKRSQIFVQYIVESVMLAVLALAFATVILSFIIRYAPFNDGYEFIPSSFQFNGTILGWSLSFALFTGLLAGVAPAWILSSFKPLSVLKNLTTARIMGKVSIQKALIVFQYSLSLTIIIFLMAFYKQFSYLADVDLGYKKDHVLVVPLNGLDEQVAEQQLLTINGVRGISALSGSFTNRFNGMNIPAWIDNKKDAISLNYYFADAGFIKNMNLLLVAGSNFSVTAAGSEERSVIINEEAVKALGIKDYQKALGQHVWINDSTKLEIAGVVKNFIYENAGNPVRPLAFRNRINSYSYLYITADAKNNQALAERVNESLKTLAPTQTFASTWLDEELARSNSQAATISLLGYLAFIAAAIASLGLLGLVIYTVEVKRKEISIRKIIGASEKELVRLLSKGFIKLLIIAGCIAVPIGYAAGFLFLQNFVIRVPFGVSIAILCFVFLLCIGLVTIVSQTWKAAVANPVKDLRME